jgi:hypothetical protein
MPRRLCEPSAASGAEFCFLARHASGDARLVWDIVRAQTERVILAGLFLLRTHIGLAERSTCHENRHDNKKESGFHLHSVRPLFG